MTSGDIKSAINEAAPDKLKPLHVSEVFLSPFSPNLSLHLILMLLVMSAFHRVI